MIFEARQQLVSDILSSRASRTIRRTSNGRVGIMLVVESVQRGCVEYSNGRSGGSEEKSQFETPFIFEQSELETYVR